VTADQGYQLLSANSRGRKEGGEEKGWEVGRKGCGGKKERKDSHITQHLPSGQGTQNLPFLL
jgi:hypothetical protein